MVFGMAGEAQARDEFRFLSSGERKRQAIDKARIAEGV